MWRLLFLIFVVVGALAALLVVILGIGVAKVAWVQSDVPAPTSAPTTSPTTQAAATPPAATQAVAVDVKPVVIPGPGVKPVVEAPAVAPAGDMVPGTIVLRGADAKLHARILRKTDGDLTSWTRTEDYASWTFNPPRGKYRVLVTRANGANSGGDFALAPGDTRKSDPHFLARAAPTGGWDVFRTEMVGVLELEEKRTTLSLRPDGELTGALMRLRKVELVPVEPLPPVRADDDGQPTIRGVTIVEAATGKPLGLLTNAMRLDVNSMPPFSLRAETSGKVGSVRFSINKSDGPIESERPFSIAGERGNAYIPWSPPLGRHTLVLTPYSERGGGGVAGKKEMLIFSVGVRSDIVLKARDANRNGNALRLEPGDEPALTNWINSQDWIEWVATVSHPGKYEVELFCSVAKGHGGDFILRIGDTKLGDDVKFTGGWDAYDRVRVGEVKLSAGKTRLTMRANDLDEGKMLMNLREIRLTPVDDDDD